MSPKNKKAKRRPSRPHLPSLPQQQRQPQSSITLNHQSFSGPLPPPGVLQLYNEAAPDGADRIIRMADRQQVHRHQLESAFVRAQIVRGYLGQSFGFTLGVLGILAGAFLVYANHSAVGVSVITGFILGLAGLFLKGQQSQREERERRDDLNRRMST